MPSFGFSQRSWRPLLRIPQSELSLAGDRADESTAVPADGGLEETGAGCSEFRGTRIAGRDVPHPGPPYRLQPFGSGHALSRGHHQVRFRVRRGRPRPSHGPERQRSSFSPAQVPAVDRVPARSDERTPAVGETRIGHRPDMVERGLGLLSGVRVPDQCRGVAAGGHDVAAVRAEIHLVDPCLVLECIDLLVALHVLAGGWGRPQHDIAVGARGHQPIVDLAERRVQNGIGREQVLVRPLFLRILLGVEEPDVRPGSALPAVGHQQDATIRLVGDQDLGQPAALLRIHGELSEQLVCRRGAPGKACRGTLRGRPGAHSPRWAGPIRRPRPAGCRRAWCRMRTGRTGRPHPAIPTPEDHPSGRIATGTACACSPAGSRRRTIDRRG